MKTLLTLCLVLIGLAGFAPIRATAAEVAPATRPAAVHQNYTEVVIGGGHRHHYRHYRHYHHRRYYYRHHRRFYY